MMNGIKRKTRADRMLAKLKQVKEGVCRLMHRPISVQGTWLGRVMAGYFNYFAVPAHLPTIDSFRSKVLDLGRRTLRRRSQLDRKAWARKEPLQRGYLPEPRVLHPWPERRFAAKHPRWKPYAGKPHVRFCAGGAQ